MGKTGFDLQDFLNYFLPGSLVLASVLCGYSEFASLDEGLSSDKTGIVVVVAISLAYVFGHLAELLSRDWCRRWCYLRPGDRLPTGDTSEDHSALRLGGRRTEDPRTRFFASTELVTAISRVFQDWVPPEGRDWKKKNGDGDEVRSFYLCWRLVEAEMSDGVRFPLRALALYNFAIGMVGASILSFVPLLAAIWAPQAKAPRGLYSEPHVPEQLGFTLLLLLVSLASIHLFLKVFRHYHQEWVRNVYRLFWVWYQVEWCRKRSDPSEAALSPEASSDLRGASGAP